MKQEEKLLRLLEEHHSLGIAEQIDYQKFYLYSLITHSTAIEGSTVTEIENQLLFDEGITAKGRTLQEQMMNLDLKAAYEQSMQLARLHADFSVEMLKSLSALVMKKAKYFITCHELTDGYANPIVGINELHPERLKPLLISKAQQKKAAAELQLTLDFEEKMKE